MKAYRKSDGKEIDVLPYYINGQYVGFIEKKKDGSRRFYATSSITIKEYYGG